MASRYRGHDEVDPRVKTGREEYQKIHGEAPPVNPGEASNGLVRVGDSYKKHSKSWRDYEGVKSTNVEDLDYADLVADSEHVYDPENNWQKYDPSESFVSNQELGRAVDVFERMMDDSEQLLEPKMVTDGGVDKQEEDESYHTPPSWTNMDNPSL